MAIYHLHLSYGSRGRGHIAANKMDYLACRAKYDKGEKDVTHIEHCYMPRFARNDPFLYWKSADLYERSNGRLFYEVQVALPSELTQQEQIALARDFSQRLTAPERLPHTLIVRRGLYDDRGRKLDTPANPHARLVFSDRGNDGIDRPAAQWFMRAQTSRPAAGGAAKSRKTKNRAWLFEVRELWAKLSNAALEKGGHEARIDHRSLERRASQNACRNCIVALPDTWKSVASKLNVENATGSDRKVTHVWQYSMPNWRRSIRKSRHCLQVKNRLTPTENLEKGL